MAGEVVARVALSDEGAQLDVLPGHFLRTHGLGGDDLVELLRRRDVAQIKDGLDFLLVHIALESLGEAIEGHFRRVGDEGEDGVRGVISHSLKHGHGELFAEFLALLVDVAVATAREVDALKRAGGILLGLKDLLDGVGAVALHQQGVAWLQLLYVVAFEVERSLKHRALTGQGDNLIVHEVERRADSPWVADGEHLARPRQAAHHIAAVEVLHGGLEHVAHPHVVLDVAGDVETLQPLVLGLNKVALHLAVQPMPHQFKHDVGVAVDARALTLAGYLVKDLINVGHVEVAAEAEVLGFPVVAAQEGMDILQAALSRCGIAQMSHIEFSRVGKLAHLLTLIQTGVVQHRDITLVDGVEDFGDGVGALGPLAEHILIAGFRIELHTGHARTLLAAVVLFLHHQIELVEAVHPRAVFFLIIIEWLQQANHRHATVLMYSLFHTDNRFLSAWF